MTVGLRRLASRLRTAGRVARTGNTDPDCPACECCTASLCRRSEQLARPCWVCMEAPRGVAFEREHLVARVEHCPCSGGEIRCGTVYYGG